MTVFMEDLYRELILDHYRNPRNFGVLQNPTSKFSLFNSACGDRIEMSVDFRFQNSEFRVNNIKFKGEGCAISIASASLLTEKVKGKKVEEIMKYGTNDILKMLGITLTPTRLKCALLPLETLQKTLSSQLVLAEKKQFGL